MKKVLMTSLTLVAFVFNQSYADSSIEGGAIPADTAIDLTHETETPPAPAESLAAQDAPAPIKEVGKASAEGANAGRSKWATFALATGAVAVAVTALILVAQNRGDDKK